MAQDPLSQVAVQPGLMNLVHSAIVDAATYLASVVCLVLYYWESYVHAFQEARDSVFVGHTLHD